MSTTRNSYAGISPDIAGLIGGVGGSVAGYLAAGMVLPKTGMLSGVARFTAAVLAGVGVSHYANHKAAESHMNAVAQRSALNPPPEFPGFSGALPLTPQTEAAFFAYADAVSVSGKTGALASIVQELATHGQTRHAQILAQHFAQHANEPFYRRLDAWLTETAQRSPETLMHVQRQSVVMAMLSDAAYQGNPNYEKLVCRAMIAGMAHDIGKISIAPELLHKATRIDKTSLENFLNEYQATVPDYPEKAQHMEFLRMVNGGRIAFGEGAGNATMNVSDVIAKVTEQPLLGEPDFADADLKASNQKIYGDIKAKAAAAGMQWITPQWEAALLNHGRRGTLSREEGAVMAAHDNIGVEMLKRADIPRHLGFTADVVNMDKTAITTLVPELAELQQMIMLSDVFEATTGQRAYNRENGKNLTPSEALLVLQSEAKRGPLKPETVQQFEASGIAQAYGALYPDIPKQRSVRVPQMQIQARTAHDEALTVNPEKSI